MIDASGATPVIPSAVVGARDGPGYMRAMAFTIVGNVVVIDKIKSLSNSVLEFRVI